MTIIIDKIPKIRQYQNRFTTSEETMKNEITDNLLARERMNRHLLWSLNPKITTSLSKILKGDKNKITALQLEWFDVAIFLKRFEKAFQAIQKIPGTSSALPIFFFQRPDPADPKPEHYLHHHTSFTPYLKGIPENRTLSIPPRFQFSYTGNALMSCHQPPGYYFGNLPIIGYQLPHLPSLLKIPDHIATEYLTRIIIHDMAHLLLPEGSDLEELLFTWHILAMSNHDGPQPDDPNPWNNLILQECTNEKFNDRAQELIKSVMRYAIDLAECPHIIQDVLIGYAKKYCT